MIRLEFTILSHTNLVTTEWYLYYFDISQIVSSVKPDNVILERNTTENNVENVTSTNSFSLSVKGKI